MNRYYVEIEYSAKKSMQVEASSMHEAHTKAVDIWLGLRDEMPSKICVRDWRHKGAGQGTSITES